MVDRFIMKGSCIIQISIVLASFVTCTLSSHFRGGYITWAPSYKTPINGSFPTVLFNYRVSFRRSSSSDHYCDASTISSGSINRGQGYIKCYAPCSGWSDTFDYKCTDYSQASDWTTGMGNSSLTYVTYNIFEVYYSGNAWISLTNGGGGAWIIKTKVDLTPRQDNGHINSSPITSSMPMYRWPNGCETELYIPARDPDNDVVRCRYAEANGNECGSICNNFPATLNENGCILTWTPTTNGIYGVAMQVEDFIDRNSTIPLSSIPLQFLVEVFSISVNCSTKPIYSGPTLTADSCIAIPSGQSFTTRITATVFNSSRSIVSIDTVSPIGAISSQVQPVSNSTGNLDYFIDVTYQPPTSASKQEILCFIAYDNMGLTSEHVCVTFVTAKSPPIATAASVIGNIMLLSFDSQIKTPTLPASLRIVAGSNSQVIYSFETNSTDVIFLPGNTSIQIVLPNALPSGDMYYIDLDRGVVETNEYCNIQNEPTMLNITGSFDVPTLMTNSTVLTEGTDDSIGITCVVSAAVPYDSVCEIEVLTGTTIELGYDIPNITEYTCVVPANSLTGTVNVALYNDDHFEDTEILILNCKTAPRATALEITIIEDVSDVTPGTVRLMRQRYEVGEGHGTITYFVDCIDINGNNVPIEEDIKGLSFIYPGPDTAKNIDDYTQILTSVDTYPSGLVVNDNGTPVLQYRITQNITKDNLSENLETFKIQVAIGPSLFVRASSNQSVVWIQDDDKPELCVVMDRTPLPRHSSEDVQISAFTADIGPNSGITWSSIPYNGKKFSTTNLTVTDISGIKTTLSRPGKWSRRRFNEYFVSTNQTIGLNTYPLSAYTYLSATSNKGKQAPIEAFLGPTVTVFPNAMPCVRLEKPISIGISFDLRFKREMKWMFRKDGSNTTVLLTKMNGHITRNISRCGDTGLYILSRRHRGERGWTDFIRVIKSACPEGKYHSAPGMNNCQNTSPVTCENGGMIDPELGLCTCPPGLAGVRCEIWLPAGSFGSSGSFHIRDFVKGNERGKCALYSFSNPFGCLCAPGFYGNDCCDECAKGSFGVRCESKCHCMHDRQCDRSTGVCANGCAPGYFGNNCQL